MSVLIDEDPDLLATLVRRIEFENAEAERRAKQRR